MFMMFYCLFFFFFFFVKAQNNCVDNCADDVTFNPQASFV